jgi:hypothetical protein
MENVRELDLGQPAIDEKTRAMYTTHAHRESEARGGRLRYLTKLTEEETKAVSAMRALIMKVCNQSGNDMFQRSMICTPCAGDYDSITAWVVAMEGSPPRGMIFIASLDDRAQVFKIDEGSRRLGVAQAATAHKFVDVILGGHSHRLIETVPPVIVSDYIK